MAEDTAAKGVKRLEDLQIMVRADGRVRALSADEEEQIEDAVKDLLASYHAEGEAAQIVQFLHVVPYVHISVTGELLR